MNSRAVRRKQRDCAGASAGPSVAGKYACNLSDFPPPGIVILKNILIGSLTEKKPQFQIAALIYAAAAAGRGPFSWRAASAPPRNSGPPSDSRAEGPICRDIVPGSCRTGFAGAASAI